MTVPNWALGKIGPLSPVDWAENGSSESDRTNLRVGRVVRWLHIQQPAPRLQTAEIHRARRLRDQRGPRLDPAIRVVETEGDLARPTVAVGDAAEPIHPGCGAQEDDRRILVKCAARGSL
jgi:hypothetical protein